jgi:uncharacterized linocin/CFP29 family protein
MDVLAQARVQLGRHHVEGPYHLILGPTAYRVLMSGAAGDYPLHRRVKDLLGGDIHLARHAGGGFLLSERGGDAKLTLGQDISVGFHDRVGTSLHLFLTESFTFRVLAPEAVICFSLEG